MYLVRATALLACLLVSQPVSANDPPPYPKFTFKRVKPPKAGETGRITVQIVPKAETAPDAPTGPSIPKASATYDWYWDIISPKLADGGPGRLEAAENALTTGPDGVRVLAPRLQHLQQIANEHGISILQATVGTQVSPALVLAVMGIESAGRVDAVSPKGATGLMQLMPATAERFGIEDIQDAGQNVKGGVAYLDWLMTEFERDPILVLAAYNAGENAVKKNNGVPEYQETRDYVPKVLAAWKVAKGLCMTPPLLVSDGCVFRLGDKG